MRKPSDRSNFPNARTEVRWTLAGTAASAGVALLLLISPVFPGAAAPAVRHCGAGYDVGGVAYDPARGLAYVLNNGTYNASPPSVQVIDPTTCSARTIGLLHASGPAAAAYDPANQWVYVADYALDQVYVLNGSSVVATIAGGWFAGPNLIGYDPAAHLILVTNSEGQNLTAIQGKRVVGSIATGSGPVGVAFDGSPGTILVTNRLSRNLTVVANASSPVGSPESSVSLGNQTLGAIVYDPSDHLNYVVVQATSFYSNGTVLVLRANGTMVGTIGVGHVPLSLGYSGHTRRVYVGVARDTVWELSGVSSVGRVYLGPRNTPGGFAYDPQLRAMLVTGDHGAGAGALDLLP
jgi:DNA-binding beta-propeller fold protein YncE